MRTFSIAALAAVLCLVHVPAEARKMKQVQKVVPKASKAVAKSAKAKKTLFRPAKRFTLRIWSPTEASESMRRQNEQADHEGLVRMNDEIFEARKREGDLVPLPHTDYVRISVEERYQWVHPWVREFLIDQSRIFSVRTGSILIVTSATRPVERQLFIIRLFARGHAGSVEPGPNQSCHLTGSCIDIGKGNLSPAARKVLREMLVKLRADGYIEFIDERACFHIMVFRHYGTRTETVAQREPDPPQAFAVSIE